MAEPGSRTRLRTGIRLAGAAPALLAAACGSGSQGAESGATPTVVEAVVAAADTIDVSVRSVGSLEAEAHVELKAEAEGRITSVLFEEGGSVRRGQVLLMIDQERLLAETRAAEAAVERSRVEAENLHRQVERNRGLLRAGAISEQAYDDLETRWEAARARLDEAAAALGVARERLAEATVRAPFDGRAAESRVDTGDFVSRGDPLVELVDDDSLEIAFAVPERLVGRLRIASPVRLTVQSHPDRWFEGRVDYVSPVVDPVNRTVRLKARVPNAERELRAGQFANVLLGLERKPDAVVVPEAAVVPSGGETFVFLVEGGVARRRAVQVGERSPGIVEMVSGVRAGDTIVVAGQQKLRDGSAVAPRVRPLRPGSDPEEQAASNAPADGEG